MIFTTTDRVGPTPPQLRAQAPASANLALLTVALWLFSLSGFALAQAFEVNSGDVFVGAPVGVVMESASEPDSLMLVAPGVGVQVAESPPPPVDRITHAPRLGVHFGSGIAGLVPNIVEQGVAGQQIEIEGVELDPVQIRVLPPDGISIAETEIDPSGARVLVTLDVAADAAPGLRRLELVDATGEGIPPLSEAVDALLVRAPVPVITSVTPSLMAPGDLAELEIRGRNLRGLPVQGSRLTQPEPEVLITPASGIDIGSATAVDDAGTLIRVPIAVAEDAVPGPRLVQVRTQSAVSSDQPEPANVLNIATGSLRLLDGFASPRVGVLVGSPAVREVGVVGSLLGVSKGPAITALQPETALQGASLELHLSGTELTEVDSIQMMPDDGLVLDPLSLNVAPDAVRIALHIASDAPPVPRRVIATLRDGSTIQAPRLFQILQPAPEISAISPNFIVRDGTARPLFVQGRNLSQVQSARLLPDDGLVLQEFTPLSDSTARMVVLADPVAMRGARVLQVFNQTLGSSSEASPFNTLEVVDASGLASGFVTPRLGVFKPRPGQDPTSSVPLPSALLSVNKGPIALGIAPDLVDAGQAATLMVFGRELDGVGQVEVEPDAGVLVQNLTVADDGRSMEVELLIAADAEPGARYVLLRGAAGPIRFRSLEASRFSVRGPDFGTPVTTPDAYTLASNGQLAVDATNGVLRNDTDPRDLPLFAALVSLPASGTLVLNADGGFVYTPAPDFAGIDAFQYVASNGEQSSAITRVQLAVEQPLNAIDDEYSVAEGQLLSVDGASGLLANDILTAGIEFDLIVVDPPSLGSIAIADDGSFEYQPSVGGGVDEFSYRLVSPEFSSLPARVRIEVLEINEPPVAVDDQFVVEQDIQLTVAAGQGVLANDSDPDGDLLTARVIQAPAFGSLVLDDDGGFRYTPQAGFSGSDDFRYEAADPNGLTDSARVMVIVNDSLVAVPDHYMAREDELLLVGPEQGLLANDSAVANGALTVELLSPPLHGTLDLSDDGSFVYRPQTPDYFGPDEFVYRLRDDRTESDSATVVIDIQPVNDPPDAVDDAFIADENAELNISAPGVLENDSDIESETLSASLLSEPEFGQLTLLPDGSLSYVPAVNFRGIDQFEYLAVDPEGEQVVATVEIVVTQPPTATNDVYFVDADTPIEILDPDQGLLINDHDAPEDDELTAALRDEPLNGAVDLNPDGTFIYVPDSGFIGIDVFTYEVSDGRSSSNPGTVTLPVGITSFPRAMPDEYQIAEDQTATIPADQGVLINDLDADTPLEELEAFLVDRAWNPRSGPLDVTVQRDGGFTVTPWPDFSGETFFIYQVFDGTDVSNAALVTLDVIESNDGVDAVDDEFGVLRNTVFRSSAGVRFNDEYDRDFPVAFEVVEPTASGSLILDPNTGGIEYTPDPDFSGIDTFSYRIYQIDTGIEDIAVATLRVNGPPLGVDDLYLIDEDTITSISSPLLNDSDPDGDLLAFRFGEFRENRPGVFPRELAVRMQVNEVAPLESATLFPGEHFYGEIDVEYEITDGLLRDKAVARVRVAPVPEAPIAEADRYLTAQGLPLIVNDPAQGFMANDFDPDFQSAPGRTPWRAVALPDTEPLVATLVDGPANGQLTFSPQGVFSYTPDPGFFGVDLFTYFLTDATGRSSETVDVEIVVNSSPLARDDQYVSNEDVELSIPAADGVLANDDDQEDDPLRVRIVGMSPCGPCNGGVTLRQDGSFVYTPDADFNGTDQFSYRVDDGVGGFDIASVTITVLAVNDAPRTEPDTYRVAEDATLVVPEPQGLLRNDREVDGDGLTAAELNLPPAFGTVEVQPDGAFSYVPDPDYAGNDEFTYRVFDGTGLFSDDRVEVRVTSVNDAPVATPDEYSVSRDETLIVDAIAGVLSNDRDVDSEILTAAMAMPPLRGVAFLDPDGAFEYTPDPGFTGTDQFTYQVDDGLGAIDSAQVLIVVEPLEPVVEVQANDDFFAFEGPSLSVAAPGVLANDGVQGADLLLAELLIAPEFGAVSLDPDGGFSYVSPDGFEGVDGFSYSASADGVSDIARVTLSITAAENNPPRAQGEQYLLLEDQPLDSTAVAGLLDNDTDFEGDALTVEVETPPVRGTLELFVNGHFIYQPDPNVFGEDALTYRVSDGRSLSEPVTAMFDVIPRNDPPSARDDLYSVTAGEALIVTAAQGLLANDQDVDSDELLVEAVDSPAFGVGSFAQDGSFEYQPNADFEGVEVLNYSVTDLEASAGATLRITVKNAPNQPPVAQGEFLSTSEDTPLIGAIETLLLGNDVDPDGDALAVVVATEPANGLLTLADGAFRYEPAPDFAGTDSVEYRVSDGIAASDLVVATIDVAPVNDPPLARPDVYSTGQDTPLNVDAASGVLANDFDVEGDPIQVMLETDPVNGLVSMSADGGFEYLPSAAFAGRDEFTYRASDGMESAIGRVAIDVLAAGNRPPLARGEQFVIAEDTVLDTRDFESLLANDSDPDGDPIALTIVAGPDEGDVELLGDGHVRYTPVPDSTGTDAMSYAVTDGVDGSPVVEMQVVRLPVNDAPRTANDVFVFTDPERDLYSVSPQQGVLANDFDPDGDALISILETQPAEGSVTLTPDGGFEYRPDAPGSAQISWRYLAVDPAGAQRQGQVTLLIGDVPLPEQLFADGFESSGIQ